MVLPVLLIYCNFIDLIKNCPEFWNVLFLEKKFHQANINYYLELYKTTNENEVNSTILKMFCFVYVCF